ncbi:MAG: iron-containing alcohol dehydrogenase [Rikenellaceae bacterium]
MNNFIFQNPTKLIFGEGMISRLSKQIPEGAKIMLTYGGGSIKKNGIYDQVISALKGFEVIEFGGIEANPDYDTLMRAVEICKSEGIDFLLAVGGGSIIDGTKFISTAYAYPSDPWEFLLDESKANVEGLPIGAVLTLPATASEMNNGAVVSRRTTNEKYPFHSKYAYPKFSILDPTAVYSLPKKQIANGIVDTYAHTLEQYLTYDNKTLVMDRWAESLLQTLIELAPSLMKDEQNYDAASNFMLTATMGLNGFISMGTAQDWATHMIGHELTALCGLDHGESLAVVFPGTMSVMRESKKDKLLQYGERVWGVSEGDDNAKIDATIAKTEEFFRSLDVRTRLSEYNVGDDTIAEIVGRFASRGWSIGERGLVDSTQVQSILNYVK